MLYSKRLLFILAGLGSILLLPAIGIACTCISSYSPWLADLSDADAVFTGKVNSVIEVKYDRKNHATFTGDRLVTFEVDKSYKGIAPTTRLISLYADYETTSCSFGVDDRRGPAVGERWMVFANKMTSTPQMYFGGSCNSSRKIRSKDQLKDIEDGFAKFSQRQGIIGSVVLSFMKLAKDAEAEISGEGVNQRSKVDDEGYFWFPLDKPGKYTVSVKVPFSTSLINAVEFPKMIDKTMSSTTFVYDVQLKEGEFDYNELNVDEPR